MKKNNENNNINRIKIDITDLELSAIEDLHKKKCICVSKRKIIIFIK
jgi:hypothetical protein